LEKLQETTAFVILDSLAGADDKILKDIVSKIDPFRAAVQTMFSKPVAINNKDATALLASGKRAWCSFGSLDPVWLANGEVVDCFDSNNGCFGVMWKHFIMFADSEENRQEIMSDVLTYMEPSKTLPKAPLSCVVFGPPKSGKSTVSQTLSDTLGFVNLNMADIIDEVRKAGGGLGREIEASLASGEELSDVLKVQALQRKLRTDECIRNGWVLDNFPVTESQAKIMLGYQIIPDVAFSLDLGREHAAVAEQRFQKTLASVKDTFTERFNLPGSKLNPPPEEGEEEKVVYSIEAGVAPRQDFGAYSLDENLALRVHFQRTFENLYVIDGTKSKWFVVQAARDQLQLVSDARANFYRASREGKPSSVRYITLPRSKINDCLGRFKSYCPVAWAEEKVLARFQEDQRYTVEYQHEFYQMSSRKNYLKFLKNPQLYLAERNSFPKDLPRRLLTEDNERVEAQHCQLSAYCPVTIRNSIARGALEVVRGKKNTTVVYKGQLYRFKGEAELKEFMARPELFVTVSLPTKMPPAVERVTTNDLLKMGHALGHMEQAVANIIQKALVDVGQQRLKFPGLSVSKSALLYIVAYLKAKNPKNKDYVTSKNTEKMKQFVADCGLISQLAKQYQSEEQEVDEAACSRYDLLRNSSSILKFD
jgi:adenylate/nucleoside-diphosphate kinase